jgi:hypothetical protein
MKTAIVGIIALAGLASMAQAQINFVEIGRVDLRARFDSTNPLGLGTNINGVAWNGTDLYAAGFKNGSAGTNTGITRVSNALTSPTFSNFGSIATPASRGYSGLDINRTTLISSWDSNVNNNDSFRAFNLDATNTQRWNNGTALGISFQGKAGPAFNPGIGGAGGLGSGPSWVIQGSGFERVLNETTGGANAFPSGFNNANINIVGGATTAFRDMDYDPATGDIYMRVFNDVSKGVRTLANQYNGGTGLTIIANNTDNNQTGTNIQFLNTPDYGNLLLWNDRGSTANGQSFFAVNKVTNTSGGVQSVNWLAPNGSSPFVPFGTGNAAYDYSYDRATNTLAVSDFSANFVYIFAVPTPGAAATVGLAGLLAARRRRS